MNLEECNRYLLHRLKQVDWNNDPAFEEGSIDAIYMYTGGIPRLINVLCSRLFLLGFLDNLHSFSAQDVERVAIDLREENGARASPAVRNTGMAQTDYYLQSVGRDQEILGTRIEALERRLDHQERSLRHVVNGFWNLVNRNWPDDDHSK